jgi:hypothetical protein
MLYNLEINKLNPFKYKLNNKTYPCLKGAMLLLNILFIFLIILTSLTLITLIKN